MNDAMRNHKPISFVSDANNDAINVRLFFVNVVNIGNSLLKLKRLF